MNNATQMYLAGVAFKDKANFVQFRKLQEPGISMRIENSFKSKWRKRFSDVDGAHNSTFSNGMNYRNFAGCAHNCR